MNQGGRTVWAMASLALLVATGAGAQTPPPSPARPAATPDPAFEAAKAGFEALPETERRALQDALVWTGDTNSAVTGTFGRRTYDALLAYASRNGLAPGLPDAAARAALLRAGEAARNAARFAIRPDPASGARLGVPERLLTQRGPIPGGTRWQSADGRITVETKSYAPGESGLEAVFARLTAPSPERRVTYKLLRPDFLVVTAETGSGKSYIRYAAGAPGLRGLTIGYDKTLAGSFDRMVIAIANSFQPFPEAAPAVAAAAPGSAPTPPPSPPVAKVQNTAPAATGLVVGRARVLTTASALEGCALPSLGAAPARVVARDAVRDLVLLEAGPAATGSVPPLRSQAPGVGEDLLVLAAEAGGVTVAPGAGSADGAGVTAPLQPGAGGAPVLDRRGALAGLVTRFPAAPRLVAGVMPPARYAVVPADRIGAFLGEAGLAPRQNPPVPEAQAGSLGRAAAGLSGAVVGILCRS